MPRAASNAGRSRPVVMGMTELLELDVPAPPAAIPAADVVTSVGHRLAPVPMNQQSGGAA